MICDRARLVSGAKRFRKPPVFRARRILGGVESLIGHPASMTHASAHRDAARDGAHRQPGAAVGGIEEVEDLIADLEQGASGRAG